MPQITPKLLQTIYISLSYAILHLSRLVLLKSKILTFLKNRKGYSLWCFRAFRERVFFLNASNRP